MAHAGDLAQELACCGGGCGREFAFVEEGFEDCAYARAGGWREVREVGLDLGDLVEEQVAALR